jgi:hypothetical protein
MSVPFVPEVPWIGNIQSHPICDIPWFGRAVVLSNGSLQFCCFSDAEVGNVNEKSFEEIWTGPDMQRIRRTLAEGELPRECQSPSCPVYRDKESGSLVPIIQRLPHDVVGLTAQRHADFRERLSGSSLAMTTAHGSSDGESLTVRQGESVEVTLRICIRDYRIFTDRYLGIRYPDGQFRFLPTGGPQPIPYSQNCETMGEDTMSWTLPVMESTEPGEYLVAAALYEPLSSPGFAVNCYWSSCRRFRVS